MKNITLALDEETLAAGRTYAQRHGTTLNSLVRDLLRRAAVEDRNRTVAELFRLMDTHSGDSRGETWTRDDLYVRSS
jgi:plasmid stability protein